MVEYRDSRTGQLVERRSSGSPIVIGVLIVAALVVGFLFATGFWSANVTKSGELPSVAVKADGGALPTVDLESKKITVGTKKTTVDVPTVETKKQSIDVPVVGVSEGKH